MNVNWLLNLSILLMNVKWLLNFVECKIAPQFHVLKSLTYRQAAGIQTQVEVSSMTSQMIYILKSPRLKKLLKCMHV